MRNRFKNDFTFLIIILLLLTVPIYILLFKFKVVENNNITWIAPSFLLILTIVQLVINQKIQQSNYVKDFLSEFIKNSELYDAYFDLIYTYRNEIFQDVQKIALAEIERKGSEFPSKDMMPIFDCFKELNSEDFRKNRGYSFYYPRFFHFSIEERRLDRVLIYFNTVAFYWYRGLISMNDIVDLLGDYIVVIMNRDVIKDYLNYAFEKWKYQERPPYLYLPILFTEFKKYNSSSKIINKFDKLNKRAKEYLEM